MAHPGMLFAELGFPVTPMLPHILARAVEATDFRPSRFLTQSPSHQGRCGPSSSSLLAMAAGLMASKLIDITNEHHRRC